VVGTSSSQYPNINCVAGQFEDLASELLTVSSSVSDAIAPLNTFLAQIDANIAMINQLKTIGKIIEFAVTIAKHLPYVGNVFNVVSTFVKTAVDAIEVAASKANQFHRLIGNAWKNSVGKLSNLIYSFDSKFAFPIATVAYGMVDLAEDQCAAPLVTDIIGVNIFGMADSAFVSLWTFRHSF